MRTHTLIVSFCLQAIGVLAVSCGSSKPQRVAQKIGSDSQAVEVKDAGTIAVETADATRHEDAVDVGDSTAVGDTADPGDTTDVGDTADSGDTTAVGDTADPGNITDVGDTTDNGDIADIGDNVDADTGVTSALSYSNAWAGAFAVHKKNGVVEVCVQLSTCQVKTKSGEEFTGENCVLGAANSILGWVAVLSWGADLANNASLFGIEEPSANSVELKKDSGNSIFKADACPL